MKIENSGSDRLNRAQLEGASPVEGARGSGPASATSGVSGRDQAALSDRARLLGKARAAFASVEETRADRVAALRSQVQSGAYRIPYNALASRMAGRL